jgi:hypothetical protein
MDRAPNIDCKTCGVPFYAGRAWSVFCTTKCRNAFHGAEARKEAIKAAGVEMYNALAKIAAGPCEASTLACAHCLAQATIADLKPPIEPKALLQKAGR